MKPTITIILLATLLLFSTSCKDELEDCYETVCIGPNNTNCREEPVADSGCFPRETGMAEETSQN